MTLATLDSRLQTVDCPEYKKIAKEPTLVSSKTQIAQKVHFRFFVPFEKVVFPNFETIFQYLEVIFHLSDSTALFQVM